MALYIVGAGLSSEYLSLRAIKALSRARKVYIDTYTSIAPGVDEELVARLAPEAEVVRATRLHLENEAYRIVEEAAEGDVAVLVPGDPFIATTHVALAVEARRRGVEVVAVPGVSGIQAVLDATGLQFYRFGKPVTLVYPEEGLRPYSTLEVIAENRRRGLHTLVLLDLRLDQGKAMTIPEAVNTLFQLERELAEKGEIEPFLGDALFVAVARAGLPDAACAAGPAGFVASQSYPPPPHSLVVAAPRLHPMEEEALEAFCNTPREKT
jgi:diphthine synthase